MQYGTPGTDVPVPGFYFGGTVFYFATFDTKHANWYIQYNPYGVIQFGYPYPQPIDGPVY